MAKLVGETRKHQQGEGHEMQAGQGFGQAFVVAGQAKLRSYDFMSHYIDTDPGAWASGRSGSCAQGPRHAGPLGSGQLTREAGKPDAESPRRMAGGYKIEPSVVMACTRNSRAARQV
jgi:hypothetical protein